MRVSAQHSDSFKTIAPASFKRLLGRSHLRAERRPRPKRASRINHPKRKQNQRDQAQYDQQRARKKPVSSCRAAAT